MMHGYTSRSQTRGYKKRTQFSTLIVGVARNPTRFACSSISYFKDSVIHNWFLSARKADLKKGFQNLVVVVVVVVVVVLVVGTRVKKRF
jgi:hypothetical protein